MWYKEFTDIQKTSEPIPDQLLIDLKTEAKKCLDAETASYSIRSSKTNSNFQWMKTVMSKGVTSDKIAAYTVAIQDNPVHHLDALLNLIGMVKVAKKKDCMTVIETLVELFLENLLIPSRKLIAFRERPLTKLNDLSSGNAITRKKYLTIWYFEDQLKEMYASFVLALNNVAHDTVDTNKEKAIAAMHKLLANNSEQEKNLLMYIVNKLGDPSRKVASKTIYCLTKLLNQHSNMQGVVLSEIEKVLFRTNISARAQYYGLCFLTQFYMCHEASDIARRLIDVYFSFFKACVKKGEVNTRMMSALLIGVNRAYPYANLDVEKISDHINTMYRVVHIANFNISLHALGLLYQVSSGSNKMGDRFFSALYKKLLDPQISNTTHQAMLLNLVYKALCNDPHPDRVRVIIKRLLQISIYMQPSLACGVLYLISQLIKRNENLSALFLKSSIFSATQEEEDEDEKFADVKEENEECGDNKKENEGCGDNKEERDVDEKPNVVDLSIQPEASSDPDRIENNQASGWLHTTNVEPKSIQKPITEYNGLCRNPLYGGGQFCAYTELNVLKQHFHPTVSLFASNLLNGITINYTGDPLKDFSLIRFLDRFVFKNPKKQEDVSKQGHHPTFGKRKDYRPRGSRALAVNSSNYLREEKKNIPVDELFLYMFLQKKSHLKKEHPDDEDESDLESVGSEEFEEMLDKMAGTKDLGDEDLDYMDNVEVNLKNRKEAADAENKDEVEEDDASEDNENVDDDLEMNEDDKELIGLSDDEDSDLMFDSDEDEEAIKKKIKADDNISSLFASAEEFASLLEDEGSSNVAPGGSNAWSNKDNANVHQISWEDKRNKWIKGHNKPSHKNNKKFIKNKKPEKRKQTNKNTQSKKRKIR